MDFILKTAVLHLMLLTFCSLLVNLLFAVMFRKRIHRLLTVAVGVATGIIGFFIPSILVLNGVDISDALYPFLVSFTTSVIGAFSMAFVQVLLKLRKDEAQ